MKRIATIAMAAVVIVATISVCVIRVNSGPRQCIEAIGTRYGILAGDAYDRMREQYENLGLGFMLDFDFMFEGGADGRAVLRWVGHFDTPNKVKWTSVRNGKSGWIWPYSTTYYRVPPMGMYRFEFFKNVDGVDVPLCVIRRAFVW